jgi:2-octaprenyl-6-methoxyphenol hydroxylase
VSDSAKISDSNISTDYDIVISGGGVVGCLTALALATQTSFSVLLLEAMNVSAKTATSASQTTRFDARVIALSADSLTTLETLGVSIDDIVHQAIEQIHVSDRGHIGQVKLTAKEQGVAALGKVVAIEALGEYLLTKVKSFNGQIDYKCPVKIESAKQTE